MQDLQDYYRDLHIPIFDQAMVDRIATTATDVIDNNKFSTIKNYRSTEKFYFIKNDEPILAEMLDRCNCKSTVLLMFMTPNFVMDIHKDIYYLEQRKTALFLPIAPVNRFSPTLYWENENSTVPLIEVPWQIGKPKILNVQHWHSVKNNENWRVMLQISLDKHYDEVIDLIEHNRLFDGIDCRLDVQ